ncbi:MAG: hypothetical protein ACE5HQ_00965 [Gemmatimonadota bacterium]
MNGRAWGGSPPLTVVYGALAGGVIAFAALAWALGPVAEVRGATLLRWVWLGVALFAIFGAAVVAGRLPRGADEVRTRKTAIVVWAVAEGQALLGLADYLVTGDRVPAAVGMLLFAYLYARHRPSSFQRSGSGR